MSHTRDAKLVVVAFGQTFLNTGKFEMLFKDTMSVIEDTATYLDGEGRVEAKTLVGQAALAYTAQSMRLTTRMMMLASWVLLVRSVKEGEEPMGNARRARHQKIMLPATHSVDFGDIDSLPEKLQALMERTASVSMRVVLLDLGIFPPDDFDH